MIRFDRMLVVTKHRFMGDTIVATPVIRELRRHSGCRQLDLLTGSAASEVMRGCPNLDQVMLRGRMRMREMLVMAHKLRQQHYNAVFLLDRSLSSALLARMAGIPARIGHRTEFRGWLLTHSLPYEADRPEIECGLELLRSVSLPVENGATELWLAEDERIRGRELLKRFGVEDGSPIIAFQPGANDPYKKQWDTARFAQAADALRFSTGAVILLLGGAGERGVGEVMAEQMAQKSINLIGQTSLREVMAVISECRLLAAGDTGLIHIAAALGTSTVGVHGPMTATKWGYGPPNHRTVTGTAPKVKRLDRATNRVGLDALDSEAVISAALDLWKSKVPIS